MATYDGEMGIEIFRNEFKLANYPKQFVQDAELQLLRFLSESFFFYGRFQY